MVTMAERICELRTERNMSRPALSTVLGLPKMTIDKFESGRLTPSQEQQEKLASYFGVSAFYLRGESNDRTQMENWMDVPFSDTEPESPAPPPKTRKPLPSASGNENGTLFDSLLQNRNFCDSLKAAVLEDIKSPEGRKLIREIIRQESSGKK